MITLISFILVLVGCANWLTIGILQFDFVAGLFGSQANIFSRIVYVIIGVASIIVTINLIKNKGKLTFNLKKLNKKTMETSPVFVPEENKVEPAKSTEFASDMSQNNNEKAEHNTDNQLDTNKQNKYAKYRQQFGEYARDMSHKTATHSPVTHNTYNDENNIENKNK